MITIKEISELTGVSARALRYYDKIGLFHPKGRNEAGYRIYDEKELEVLQQIIFFRELDTQLLQIKDEKNTMLAQAETYLDARVATTTDEQYGEGFSNFLYRAITAFYER